MTKSQNSIEAERLLDRDLSTALSAELREQGSGALRRLVDYSLEAFQRCSVSARAGDEQVGVLLPHYHLIEMLDAVEVLLGASAVAPSALQLRSAFEALLSLEWVCREDTSRRGAAYVVTEIHARIARLEGFDGGTGRGKQLAATFRKDPLGNEITLPKFDSAQPVSALNDLLMEPHLKEAASEFNRLKSTRGGRPRHYELWSGPGSVEQLAGELGYGAIYELFYRPWSARMHARDMRYQLSELEGQSALRPLRSPDQMQEHYFYALMFGQQGTRTLLTHYRPGRATPNGGLLTFARASTS